MKTVSLLLLVALAALAEAGKGSRHAKRELLVRSKRRWVLSTLAIEEEDPGPYPKRISKMFNDKINAHKENHMYRISGNGVTEPPLGVFSIDEESGVVFAHKPIDRETHKDFHIKFDILDKYTGKPIDNELAFDIDIKDINDNPPIFLHPKIQANVKENLPEGYLPVQLQAIDIDKEQTVNSTFNISLISQYPQDPKIQVYRIDDRMSQLTFKGCFDHNKARKYEIIVKANDHGTPSLSSTAVVTLDILDANTHPPKFKEEKVRILIILVLLLNLLVYAIKAESVLFVQYHLELHEATIKHDVLRIAVEDADTPQTPGWRAKYSFIKGNEEGYYKLETDSETNEGILSIIKEKDYEKTTFTTLVIGVENEEPLYVCTGSPPPPHSVQVMIKVIDINDQPEFEKENVDIYQKEEEEPGKVLFTPKVRDVDSDVANIRYVLLEDKANWVTINNKTGKITSTKRMDRESPFVDENNIYGIIIGAIDDGEPPATGTCTVRVHLGDINDNKPRLVNNSNVMCGNKVNKVMVLAKDLDANPFSGPFTFSLGGDSKTLKEEWKIDPAYGEEAGLISLKTLPYGNYSVPLIIHDQQSIAGHVTVQVMVCNCGEKNFCRNQKANASSLAAAGIGLIFAALLLFLLLLLLFVCHCGKQKVHMDYNDGNQSLIQYNQEGGGSACMAPTNVLKPTTNQKDQYQNQSKGPGKIPPHSNGIDSSFIPEVSQSVNEYPIGLGVPPMYSTKPPSGIWGSSSGYYKSYSLWSQHHLGDHITGKLKVIGGNHDLNSVYQPHGYAFEGQETKCLSLDELSFHNLENDLQFLNDLGPTFKTLGGICQQSIKEKNIQL
ncbi:cadherin-like protein 26 isoform X2 [Mastacembelus armatus]|uniref:cadherin-like protein 26 isoform X2 n=1 Tax=Mastacembelus armatus TaxID=205130 RepID=UPI001436772D|nr:cadherin-like protein 26 isoform X2 [Mastacembelus armatus]